MPRPVTCLSEAQLDALCSYREAGRSIPWIARKLGISVKTADYHLRRLGVFPPGWKMAAPVRTVSGYARGGHAVRYFTPEEDARLEALSAEGLSYCEIGRTLGRKPHSVRARLIALANRALLQEEAA